MNDNPQHDRSAQTDTAAQLPSRRLLLRAAEAAALCNASVRTWRTWDSTGKIPQPIRMGRMLFWRPGELRAWVAAGCPDRAAWETMHKS